MTTTDIDETERHELAQVMHEIAEAMGARSAALTLHPEDGPPRLVHTDSAAGLTHEMLIGLAEADLIALRPDEDFRWLTLPDTGAVAMVLPVRPVPGHSRLLVTVFFDHVSDERRLLAEQVYLRRRPFAVGFFRLWQLERVQRRRTSALETALNLTELAVFLLDRAGCVVFTNQAAQNLLDNNGGLLVRERRLHARDRTSDRRLVASIAHVLDDARAHGRRRAPMLAIEQEQEAPLIVSILPPTMEPSEPGDIAAIVFALDPCLNTDGLIEAVGALFALTRTEARLARLLTNGSTLADAAAQMNVREATARNYLKQIFVKTNTNRQADLVRLMLSSLLRTSRSVQLEVV